MVEPRPIEELIEPAARGERAAVEEILRRLYPRVQQRVHRQLYDFRQRNAWVLPLFSTGDIVQEVFLRAVGDLANFRGNDESSLVAWLAAQVEHRILDLLRHHGAQRRDQRRRAEMPDQESRAPADAGPTPSQSARAGELLSAYGHATADLGSRELDLLDRRMAGQQSWREIAEELGYASEEASRQAFRRLQAKLLARLSRMHLAPGADSADGAGA